VCGGVLPQKIFEIWSTEMPFPAFWVSKFALKFVLTILVFEIKERKNAQKVKKSFNRNFSIRGIILRGKLLIRGIIAKKWYFLHSEHPKNNKIINNNLSLLSGRKT
jgi:hypothetical protein